MLEIQAILSINHGNLCAMDYMLFLFPVCLFIFHFAQKKICNLKNVLKVVCYLFLSWPTTKIKQDLSFSSETNSVKISYLLHLLQNKLQEVQTNRQ